MRMLQAAIDAESVRLDHNDGVSSSLWVDRLQAEGLALSFKARNTAPPADSELVHDSFHVILQTDWQRDRYQELGKSFAGIDGTHNTMQYKNMTLFTILVCDKWGHGAHI